MTRLKGDLYHNYSLVGNNIFCQLCDLYATQIYGYQKGPIKTLCTIYTSQYYFLFNGAPNWECILHDAAAATQWFQFQFSWPKIYRLHYSYLTYELSGYTNASLKRSRVGATFATCKSWTRNNNKNMKTGVINILHKISMLHNYIYIFLSVIYLQITENKILKILFNFLHVRLV